MATRPITLGSLDLSQPTALGAQFRVGTLDGWDGTPGSTVQLTQRMRAPGAWTSNLPQVGSRPITMAGTILAPDLNSLLDARRRLLDAVPLSTPARLTVTDPDVGAVYCNVIRQGPPLADGGTETVKPFSIGLIAADPRKFANPLTSATGLPSQSGGLTFPTTFPQTWTAVTTSGAVSFTNPGDITGPVVVRITGPLPNFRVTHVAASGTHVFAMSLGLGVGEYVDIWMEQETVLAMGQASRAAWVTSRGWAGFEPGLNTWSFSSDASVDPTQGASMYVSATPAWQ